jgi:hypothetical protein
LRKSHRFEDRLAALTAKSVASQSQGPGDFDWDFTVDLPFWFPRRLAAAAITHFYLGEHATANICTQIQEHLELPEGRDFLELQAIEERRHAELYSHYLGKLGVDPQPSSQSALYERASAWRGAPQAIVLAYHGILEGESVRLQQIIDKWLPCPLFKDISAVIAKDEARHIAFGKLYLRESLPSLSRVERLQIFRWIKSLWFDTARDVLTRFAPPRMIRAHGGVESLMAAEWPERIDDMESLRLFTASERFDFAASC